MDFGLFLHSCSLLIPDRNESPVHHHHAQEGIYALLIPALTTSSPLKNLLWD